MKVRSMTRKMFQWLAAAVILPCLCIATAMTAAAQAGLVSRHTTVRLPGGELEVRWAEENRHLYMTGPAVTVFEGEIFL